MSISAATNEPLAADVRVTGSELVVTLVDGRVLSVPLEWFPRLRDASPEQRQKWEFLGDGDGIHWPEVDEDISGQTSPPACRC